jgi:hypothetical protein
MKRCFGLLQGLSFLLLLAAINGCEKKTDDTVYDKPADYFQLKTGKYVIYRLDSTRFVNFGQDEVVVSYQAKDVVEGLTTDLLGRPAWRVVRYLRDINSTNDNDWREEIDYEVVPGDNYLEVYENNLRFIKLHGPVKEGHNWIGNGYLPDEPFSNYEFSAAVNIQFWDYTYEETNATLELNGKTYDSTITITQIDDSSNVPILDPGVIAQKTIWTEKYAKNIGLVYKNVVIWEYQPPTGTDQGRRVGFGIRLSIIDHN